MRAYLLATLNYVRFKIKKIIARSNLEISNIQRVSLSTKIELLKGSKLRLGYNICISQRGSIFVGQKGFLNIKDKVYFNKGIFISCQNKITIGENCLFGPDVKIIDNNHRFDRENGVSAIEHSYGDIYIGKNSWVGANVVILKNAYIGEKCVIGAGCVINEKIPNNSIVTLDNNNIIIKPIEERVY